MVVGSAFFVPKTNESFLKHSESLFSLLQFSVLVSSLALSIQWKLSFSYRVQAMAHYAHQSYPPP